MLSHKTVFVLGAGASMPYGFPTGRDMLNDAREWTRDDLKLVTGYYLNEDEETALLAMLADTQEESLDAVLETQPERIRTAGKRAMARQIWVCEHKMPRRLPDGDWFSFLFSRMTENVTGGLQGFFEKNDFRSSRTTTTG